MSWCRVLTLCQQNPYTSYERKSNQMIKQRGPSLVLIIKFLLTSAALAIRDGCKGLKAIILGNTGLLWLRHIGSCKPTRTTKRATKKPKKLSSHKRCKQLLQKCMDRQGSISKFKPALLHYWQNRLLKQTTRGQPRNKLKVSRYHLTN